MAVASTQVSSAKLAQATDRVTALTHMDRTKLRAEWRRLFRTQPPPGIRRDLMTLALAWRIQEIAFGGLTAAEKRRLLRIADHANTAPRASPAPPIRLKPGAKLIREWHGKTHHVLVHDHGFQWNGQNWRSLTAIAHEITGTRWSGPRFFGLRRRPSPSIVGDDADE